MKRIKLIVTSFLLLMIVMGLTACTSKYELEVRNKTDEVIDIYIDNFYEGSVAPNNYLLIRRLSEGEHYIEAFDLDGDLIVDDIIYIDVNSKWVVYDTYSRFY